VPDAFAWLAENFRQEEVDVLAASQHVTPVASGQRGEEKVRSRSAIPFALGRSHGVHVSVVAR
jgi:hypothetical protein